MNTIENQEDSLRDLIQRASGQAIIELKVNGTLSEDSFQRILKKGEHVSAEVNKFIKGLFIQMTESFTDRLKLISRAETLTLDPTDGTGLISSRGDIFDGGISVNFENYGCNVQGRSTKATRVRVYEIFNHGTFDQIYGGYNLKTLCFTQGQIIGFVKKHYNLLRADERGTFFLHKSGDEFFAVCVVIVSGKLEIDVNRLSSEHVWNADYRHRFVFPRLIV